ncbi:PTS transporter subunit EIIC [Sphingomonas piscis]|uniref:PTS transporter subunit EIIC n=1 Tax=Sphingomonas piscis TaxID=2714943 RepID=A0A6G7YPB3_9SPHN|nr:N-acetylglucosamine-specific PTS transporter subunit IIBC [Sphingomonas piscis]QIK78582.1 PTS transporter subunit EIIC [Sphingomonas piscis]
MRIGLDKLQPLGRALMLPIAVLPVAAMLLRLGQPDLLNLTFIAAAGEAIFSNLGILFAIGVAVGLARENHGAAGLAGAVAYFVAVEGAKALMAVPPEANGGFTDQAAVDLAVAAWKAKQMAKLSVPCGIAAGLVSGWLYNRYSNIRLPEYLAFFGGRRFVPIAAGVAGVLGAIIFGLGFPILAGGIDALSHWVVQAGGVGLFLYGLLNRLLIITGLHHILNNLAWFIVGDFHGTTGDLKRFFAGDPSAGQFMSGFFPVMMFGLPAACLAMYHSAPPERRTLVGGMLTSLALTSFLTGVTEPIEFTFMFLAPLLYLVHAVLTGVSMALMDALGVRLGFGFSAGLFDYVLNFRQSTRPLLLLPVGLAYAGIYYAAFRFCITRLNLLTPGREPAGETIAEKGTDDVKAGAFIQALGGSANLRSVDACTTRLRLNVGEAAIDEARLRRLGARGFVRPGPGLLQVVLGPVADQVASNIRAELARAPAVGPFAPDAEAILGALGGPSNVRGWHDKAGRLSVKVADRARVDLDALGKAVPHGAAFVDDRRLHLLVGDVPLLHLHFGEGLREGVTR